MPETVHLIPLAAIDDTALPRDRTGLDRESLRELRDSILTSGLRMPVELFELAEPRDGCRYGILSGFRRIAAFREIADFGIETHRAIPAFLRTPADNAAAFAAMVEENEIRAGLSPWERARITLVAVRSGAFATIDAAIDALYPSAGTVKRARLRAVASVIELLEYTLAAPETLSERRLLRLAAAITNGFGSIIDDAVRQTGSRHPESQWQALLPYLAESERQTDTDPEPDPDRAARGGRPRRFLRLRPQLIIRREATRDGYLLRFTGREATGGLMDDILDEIERLYTVH
ncbi:MAG TPA: ParB N-terminal domain-containing protein [Amaricoccus sp.]|nr:ParB N-terminal domain-containing protein [Amaricoccus sp.]